MNIFNILSLVVGIASLVCYVIVIIDAFEDEFIRGLLCIIFPPYAWWYGWVEFDHEKKWFIFSLMVAGPFVTGALTQAAIRSEVGQDSETKSDCSFAEPRTGHIPISALRRLIVSSS